jgi:NADH-quinone oxidoreductase subunit J
MIKSSLFVIFSGLTLTSAIFVVVAKNPIFSVLFLIFSFVNVAAVLFLFNFEFLPIAFIVIYVGAVAVLFLFVLMMLNIKLAELLDSHYNLAPVGLIFMISVIYSLMFLFRFEFELIETIDQYSTIFLVDFTNTVLAKIEFFNLNYTLANMKMIAFILYSNFLFHFLLSGFVLLLAMIAAIILTLQKQYVSKTQNVYNQILADFNFALKFAK